MINIKVTLPGFNENLSISQFVGNEESILDDCKFWINKKIENPDVWFVFENITSLEEACFINPKTVVFLSAETSYRDNHFIKEPRKNFLKQFGYIYTTYETINNSIKAMPFLPWMINSNHGDSIYSPSPRDVNYFLELQHIKKTKTLSVICSDKDFTEGHRKRLDFVFGLKEHFGDQIDWFGNGINSLDQKWDGISNYKYHISIENKNKNYLISEKLMDSFLGLSFPFYYGAPNASDFFPKKSFQQIDINDLNKSIAIIEEGVKSNLYEENMKYILESKNLVCKDYNLFYRLSEISKHILSKKQLSRKNLIIKNLTIYQDKYEKKQMFLQRIFNILRKIKHFLIRRQKRLKED